MPRPASLAGLYVGLISGTSMDGIDAAIVELGDRTCRVIASRTTPYDKTLRQELLRASRQPATCTVDHVGTLDHWIGASFRDAALAILDTAGIEPGAVTAIGSHGQTLRHQPRADHPFTLQIGDPNLIAAGTGIDTAADFRRRDLAAGGEGAPLAPAFHRWLFASADHARAVVNIGGFSNVTLLPADDDTVSGFDTGPGNSLMDRWCTRHLNEPYDRDGAWAASGQVDSELLERMLADDYFSRPPPKSTGFEYFDDEWLDRHVDHSPGVPLQDIQATLCELTARTVADALLACPYEVRDVLLCGGGTHNRHLRARLQHLLPGATVGSTADHGLDPDCVEAAAFAWLAACCVNRVAGNAPAVTGAREAAILGCVYPGSA